MFQLDFEISRTIASFIKISSGHSLIIKLIFIKFFRTSWEIGGQMFWDWCLADSLNISELLKLLIWYVLFLYFQWDAFSLPELQNFMRVLDREENEYCSQLEYKYKVMRKIIQQRLKELRKEKLAEKRKSLGLASW